MKVINTKLRATTLPELLIVIILSGILFIFLFEGMNIVNKYNHMLCNRLLAKNELFYSHSTFEILMEETDSIRTIDEIDSLYFYKNGEVMRTLIFDSCGLCISYKELKDTLFSYNLSWELFANAEHHHEIDSIIIKVLIDNDTLTLKYSLPYNYNLSSTNKAYAAIHK